MLAGTLRKYKGKNTLVLALPRGGVCIGYEVAKALEAPLDTVIARKLGAPGNPEFGIGAIAPGDVIVLDQASINILGIGASEINEIRARETGEMKRRTDLYRSGGFSKDKVFKTIIIVDDGLATGVSARAAIESVEKIQRPRKIVFAAPVCAAQTAKSLKSMVDKLVCLSQPENLGAIGFWYRYFPQVQDDEVIGHLEEANKSL